MTTKNNRLRESIAIADKRDREAILERWYPACTNDDSPCKAGRLPCPSPEACRRSTDDLAEIQTSIWGWFVLAVAIVAAGYLWAGGMAVLFDWLRGLL